MHSTNTQERKANRKDRGKEEEGKDGREGRKDGRTERKGREWKEERKEDGREDGMGSEEWLVNSEYLIVQSGSVRAVHGGSFASEFTGNRHKACALRFFLSA